MVSVQGGVSGILLRLTAVVLLGVAVSACSTVPTWVDPTSWIGPDAPDEADSADTGAYPDVADMPAKPAPESTESERRQVADALVAARSNTQYSAETLRGGTEAAAPPPSAAPPPRVARAEEPAETPSEPEPAASSDQSAPAAAAPTTEVATAEEPPPAAPASGGEPAVPALPAGAQSAAAWSSAVPGAQPAVMASDSALGFQASRAPALDASVSQFVSQPIMSRYAQTASVAPAGAPAVGDAAVALRAPAGTRTMLPGMGVSDVGGPESMGGAVVANLGVLQSGATQASVYANAAGMPPAAVVFFPNDTTGLNAAARQEIRTAAAAFRARGDRGYIRVVGHSSSRTANMPLVKHLELNFRKSQARATAVARELINQGVPADKVLVNAVGDSQPVYYESMPKGEEGNRRAEIFLQG